MSNGKITKQELDEKFKEELDVLVDEVDTLIEDVNVLNQEKTKTTEHLSDSVSHNLYGIATGLNALVVNLNPPITSLKEGLSLRFKNTTANTGMVTLNINSLGAKSVVKNGGTQLSSGNLKANGVYTVVYDGVNFILQGEGGEGTALQGHVLTGKTFTNDSGTFSGTMPDRSSATTIGTRQTQGTGYVDVSPAVGYYNGANDTRVRVSDSNFSSTNIRSGTSIFGVTGTLNPSNVLRTTRSVSIAYNAPRVTVSISCGFVPVYWMAEVWVAFQSNTTMLKGTMGRMTPNYMFDGNEVRYDQGAPSQKTCYAWMQNGYSTFVSGNWLYFDIEWRTTGDNFGGQYIPDAQTFNVKFTVWGA